MQIIYNGEDITGSVKVLNDEIVDNAGGVADSICVTFSDSDGKWSKWKPEKNDTIELKQDDFSSGKTFIDEIGQGLSTFTLKALSIPQNAKTCRTQAWEEVQFTQLAEEIALKYGFALKTYGVTDHKYERVDQILKADFDFLAYRCMLEGYSIKVHDQSVVIFDEREFEAKPVNQKYSIIPISKIRNDFDYKDTSVNIYQAVEIKFGSLTGSYLALGISGPILQLQISCSSQAEADRFAKNIARYYNKFKTTMKFDCELNTAWAASTNLQINDTGISAGKYFIHRITNSFTRNKTNLFLRRPLEGY